MPAPAPRCSRFGSRARPPPPPPPPPRNLLLPPTPPTFPPPPPRPPPPPPAHSPHVGVRRRRPPPRGGAPWPADLELGATGAPRVGRDVHSPLPGARPPGRIEASRPGVEPAGHGYRIRVPAEHADSPERAHDADGPARVERPALVDARLGGRLAREQRQRESQPRPRFHHHASVLEVSSRRCAWPTAAARPSGAT